MRVAFIIIVFLHGLIHVLGFLKALNFMEVKELSIPISKPAGIVWLFTALMFFLYAYLYLSSSRQAWIFGLAAVIISQILIILSWQDAKFATLPNLVILIVVILSYANSSFTRLVEKEKAEIFTKSEIQKAEIFSEAEIKNLPEVIQQWLKNTGAIGREKTLNGKIKQKALMKMKPDQKNWNPATAFQYTVIPEPSFLWTVEMKMNRFLWFRGRDKFQNGKGEMLIKMNSLVNVVNGTGEKIDEGSLQRFLGEMVWFPSLAVSPYVSWEEIDEVSARATMKYKNIKGSGTFHFNERGDFIKFIALRFQGNEPDSKRREWILTVDDYKIFDGIKVPSKMKATWKLDDGDWTWLKLEIVEIQYNISGNSHKISNKPSL